MTLGHRAQTSSVMDSETNVSSASTMDWLNNNNTAEQAGKQVAKHFPIPGPGSERLDWARSREIMSGLCAANPQFTASVLEDYIRPIFREGDVVLEIECGNNSAVM